MGVLTSVWQGVPGRKCIVSLGRPGVKKAVHQWTDDEAAISRFMADHAAEDLYFAPAGFNDERRVADNAAGAAALWVDIDCGDGKPYLTQTEGLDALTEWVGRREFVQPSIIISSGFGLHVYWLLEQAYARDTWLGVATRFKQTLLVDGVKIDPTRTADIASLMRLPGSTNQKHGTAPTAVLLETDSRYTLHAIEKNLPTLGPQRAPKSVLPDDEDKDYTLGDPVAVVSGCQQIARSWGRADTSEPLWRAALSVLSRCEQGDSLIHEYSKADPRYTYADTVFKAKRTAGPLSCAQFESACPGGCNGCINKGAVATPIQLKQRIEAPPQARPRPKREYPWPFDKVGPYSCTPNGLVMDNDDPDVNDGRPVRISKTPIWVNAYREAMRMRDERPFAEVELGYWRSDGSEDYATIDVGVFADAKKFEQEILHMGITGVYKYPPLRSLLPAYMDEYVSKIGSEKGVRRFGWCEEGFILGSRLITEKGAKPVKVLANSSVFKQFDSAGTIKAWTKAIEAINDPKYFPLQCAVLHAAGSVILEVVDKKGATLFLQGESGAGKTTAAKAGLAIFGPPSKLTLDPTQGTMKGSAMTMSTSKNMPILLDEVGPFISSDPKKIGSLLYMTTNGEPGAALTRTRDIKDMGQWTLHGIMTSNRSLTDLSHAELLSAHRFRAIELNAGDAMPREDGAKLSVALDNYGVVGVEYLARLCALKPAMAAMFETVEKQLTDKYSFPDAARFCINSMVVDKMAGLILKDLGFISFDVDATIHYMASTLSDGASRIKTSSGILEEIIPEWLRQENMRVVQLGTGSVDTALPAKSPIAAVTATHISISKQELLEEVKRNNVSFAALKVWADKNGAVWEREQLAFGTPKVGCVTFPLSVVGMDK